MAGRACSVDGCESETYARGWCNKHWNRWRTHGNPLKTLIDRDSPTEVRFWRKVDRFGPVPIESPGMGPCWIWTGAISSNGYGHFKDGEWQGNTHSWAWRNSGRTLPPGLELDHLCHTVDLAHCVSGGRCPHRRCVNPDHLEAVTHRVNQLRGHGVGSMNAAKTHCARGHAFTGANLHIAPDGSRVCRACKRESMARLRSTAQRE